MFEMTLAFELEIEPSSQGASASRSREAPVTDEVTEQELFGALRRAARLEPGDPDYHYILGTALAERGRHQEAVPAFEDAIRLRDEPAYHSALAGALWKLGQLERAEVAFREALRLAPDDPVALTGLGTTLLGLGRAKVALPFLGQAALLAPLPLQSQVHSNLGAAHWSLDRRDEALAAFHEARRLAPGQAAVQRNLGRALSGVGQGEQALACFREAVRLRPGSGEAHLDLADAQYVAGLLEEAEASYATAARLDPKALASRERSRQAQQRLLVSRVRQELKPEPTLSEQLGRGAGGMLNALFEALAGALGACGALLRRFRTGVGLLVVAAGAYVAWTWLPPQIDRYLLKDDMEAIARASLDDDRDVLDRLMHAVRERGLQDRISPTSFVIDTRPTWRVISCDYAIPLQLLPGVERPLHVSLRVEQPYRAPGAASR
jgi:tetratricopeptide (TPR) repeat protein